MRSSKYQQFLTTLTDDSVIITATQRLAAFLNDEYAMVQSHAGRSVWVKPSIFSFSTWLKYNWLTVRFRHKELLLSELQAQVVWQRVIQTTKNVPFVSTESSEQLARAAQLASEALSLIQEWQLSFPFPTKTLSEDAYVFQNWAISFQQLCHESHWLTLADLPHYLARQFQAGELIPPKKITLIGFGELNRSYQALLQTLNHLGTRIEYYVDDFVALSVSRLELHTVDTEILTMAHWAKATLQRNPSKGFIGCIVPNLEQRHSLVLHTFNDVFAESNDSFNLSAPTRFNKISFVHSIFKLFELSEDNISVADLALLLCTPFIGAANQERVQRARLAAQLKNLASSKIPIDMLLQLANQESKPFYCPLWRQHIMNFRTALAKMNAKRFLPSFFAEKLIDSLIVLGWPGDRPLTTDEEQIIQRYQQMLTEFASFDMICGEITLKQAISQLEWMTKQILFQPKAYKVAPIKILGMLESVGMLFTDLWIMGLNDEVWPSTPHPHPFIPLELQYQFNLPHSSAMQALKFSQQLTSQFCRMGSQVIFSSARQDGDVKLRPSQLLDRFDVIDRSELNVPAIDNQLIDNNNIEYLVDDYAPSIPLGKRLKGGARLFELQAACPFRAFAEIRLEAKTLEKALNYLSAKERGIVLHRALELTWKSLGSHNRLLNESEKTVHQLIVKSVETATAEIYQDRLDQLATGFNRIAQRCLVSLVEQWLFLYEKKRPAFQLNSLEVSLQVEWIGHSLKIKIDRIDELCANKKQLLIDYKTGMVSKEDWFGERLNKPQLPLYCVTSKVPVSGILFAQIKAGELGFKGLVEEGIELLGAQTLSSEDWLAQQADWKVYLERLASQYSQGYATVDPKEGEKTCQFCQLKMFCRVGEAKG